MRYCFYPHFRDEEIDTERVKPHAQGHIASKWMGKITTSHSLLEVHAAKDFDLFYYHYSRYTLYVIKKS